MNEFITFWSWFSVSALIALCGVLVWMIIGLVRRRPEEKFWDDEFDNWS